jgi:hypothetical protein
MMNVSSESIIQKPGSRSTRTTTLYDLMAEINASTCGAELGNSIFDLQAPMSDNQNSHIAKEVARMFESGQIRFLNINDVKKKYADWLI